MNLKIGQYFGVPLYLNLFTVAFAIFIGLNGVLPLAILIISLFFVVLHEYGHCLMAKKYNWRVFDVTILPIGGVAQIDFKHNKPSHEIAVALAGPAVNLFFVIFFLPIILLCIIYDKHSLVFMFTTFFMINLMMLTFNLFVPVFPMDGGRILRAVLAYKLGHKRATWWAVKTGQTIGLTLAGLAFFYGFWLVGAIFILMTLFSQNEIAHAELIEYLYKTRIKLSATLNKPELQEATLPELILALENSSEKEEELLLLLKDLEQDDIAI